MFFYILFNHNKKVKRTERSKKLNILLSFSHQKRHRERSSFLYFLNLWSFFFFFFWRFVFFWGYKSLHYWSLQVILSVFSLSVGMFSSWPGKISRTAADTTHPAWAVVLHSNHTLESPGSFQSLFAQTYLKPVNQNLGVLPKCFQRWMQPGLRMPALWEKTLSDSQSPRLLVGLFQCLKLGHIKGHFPFVLQIQLF